MQQGSTVTRDDAIDLIRRYQARETDPILKAEFSIIAGKEEYVPYPFREKKNTENENKESIRRKNMHDTAKTSINATEELKALKAMVGSRFAARNTLYGSKNQILYMAGDLVILTGIHMRQQRVCMRNEQGLTKNVGLELSLWLFKKDFGMVPVKETKPTADTSEHTKEPQAAEEPGTDAAGKPGRQKPITVSQEVFKQLIFDTVMESQDQMSEDAANAFLDILNRYDIGSPWCSMTDGKPASGKYFFIKLKQSVGYTDPYWEQPLLAMRMRGGFHVVGKPFSDEEVESYSEIHIPRSPQN